MTDYRVGNEKSYYKWFIPGILKASRTGFNTSQRPMFICYFCGEKAVQVRNEDESYSTRSCGKIACKTLASMHTTDDWSGEGELYTR